MTAPNGTSHEDARLYGGGEGPKHWFKVRPLESPRDHWEMRDTPTTAAERRTTAAATNGWPHDVYRCIKITPAAFEQLP